MLFTAVLGLLGPQRNLLLAMHGWSWMLCDAEGTKWKQQAVHNHKRAAALTTIINKRQPRCSIDHTHCDSSKQSGLVLKQKFLFW